MSCHLPTPPDPVTDIDLAPAWGAAYWRSEAKKLLLVGLLSDIASVVNNAPELTTSALQTVYNRVENAFTLCTKRTVRKPPLRRWESELPGSDISALQDARSRLLRDEQLLTPRSPPELFQTVRQQKEKLRELVLVLKQKAVRSIQQENSRRAQQHIGTWKLLASFKQSSEQPEAPPSEIFRHYRDIASANNAPLMTQPVEQVIYGPPTREEADLVAEVSAAETSLALNRMNLSSAPGPDGLPPALIQSAFSTTALVAFLARIFSTCFRLGFTPEQWRKAENFILYKGKGALANVNSFRSISLMQILAKVLHYNTHLNFDISLNPYHNLPVALVIICIPSLLN